MHKTEEGQKCTGKEAVLSTSRLNSYGSRVLTNGIDIQQYKKNPILLYMHDRFSHLPLGRIENIRIDGDKLIGTPVFDDVDEFTRTIHAKWEAGTLKMVSIGVEPTELSDAPEHLVPGQTRKTIKKCKLVEVSIVDIGANDDAVCFGSDGKLLRFENGAENEIELLNHKNIRKMDEIIKQLGLSKDATEAEAVLRIKELQEDVATLKTEKETIRLSAIKAMVEEAKKEGKITEDREAHFINIGKTMGAAVLSDTLACLSSPVRPSEVIRDKSGTKEYTKLSEVPEEERKLMREENRALYCKLYKDEYGIDAIIDE